MKIGVFIAILVIVTIILVLSYYAYILYVGDSVSFDSGIDDASNTGDTNAGSGTGGSTGGNTGGGNTGGSTGGSTGGNTGGGNTGGGTGGNTGGSTGHPFTNLEDIPHIDFSIVSPTLYKYVPGAFSHPTDADLPDAYNATRKPSGLDGYGLAGTFIDDTYSSVTNAITKEACMKECNDDSNCVAFTFNDYCNIIYAPLQSSNHPATQNVYVNDSRTTNKLVLSTIASPLSGIGVKGYTQYPNAQAMEAASHISSPLTYEQIGSRFMSNKEAVSKCATLCDGTSNCRGFTIMPRGDLAIKSGYDKNNARYGCSLYARMADQPSNMFYPIVTTTYVKK